MVKRAREEESDRDAVSNINNILCTEPPCINEWVPADLYPSHVDLLHQYICSECFANLTKEYWLKLHIEECHNPFKTDSSLQCLEEDCPVVFTDISHRHDHLMKIHHYSEHFSSDFIRTGYLTKGISNQTV